MRKILALLLVFALAMPVVLAQEQNRAQAVETVREMIQNGGVATELDTGVNSVGDLVRTQNRIRAQDMNQFSEQVRVRAGVVEFGDSTESASGKIITVNVHGKEITVEPGVRTVIIRDGDVVVNTTELQFRNGRMYSGNSEVNVTPQQIRDRLQNAETQRLELRVQEGKAVYAHEAIQQRKLFGLFSMRATITEEYDATTGDTIKQARPWWYAFSSSAD